MRKFRGEKGATQADRVCQASHSQTEFGNERVASGAARDLAAAFARAGDGNGEEAGNRQDRSEREPNRRPMRNRSHLLRPPQKQAQQAERRDGDSQSDQGFGGHREELTPGWLFRSVHGGRR